MKNLIKILLLSGIIAMSSGCREQEIEPNQVLEEQSISAKLRNYRAHLSAPEGIESQGQGQAIFKFSKDGSELYFKITIANLENITMAHIHLRANEQTPNGPPVLWLIPDGPPPLSTPVSTNGILVERTVTESDLVGSLKGMPLTVLKEKIREGLTYVNVHTSAFPGGEIRGDIGPNTKK